MPVLDRSESSEKKGNSASSTTRAICLLTNEITQKSYVKSMACVNTRSLVSVAFSAPVWKQRQKTIVPPQRKKRGMFMANLEKYAGNDVTGIIHHISRTYQHHSNGNIQVELSGENYNLVDHGISPLRYYNHLIKDEVCVYRANSVTLCSWIISAPEEIRGDDEKERAFFDACYAFVKSRYFDGDDKFIVAATVHRDEVYRETEVDRWGNVVLDENGKTRLADIAKTDHIHIAYVPAVLETKASSEFSYKCGAKYMHDRADLTSFHSDLQRWCDQRLDFEVHVTNGSTARKGGNRTIEQVKRDHELENKRKYVITEKGEMGRWQ